LILFAIEPRYLAITAEEAGAGPGFELAMKFQFEDKLLEQRVRTLVQQFERDIPADPLYTDSLAQTLLLHLIRTQTNRTVHSSRAHGPVSEPRVREALKNDQLLMSVD